MTDNLKVNGKCDQRFEAVKKAFSKNFEKHGDVGAAVSVYLEGKPVVDLWAGWADSNRTRPWEQDTIATVASTTKGMCAICAGILVERGLLDMDATVAKYWPEFAQAGKENMPVRYLLTHEAGLPGVKKDMGPETLYQWDVYTDALARTEPWWEPGTAAGYHALTFGYLVGEIIRRISGMTMGQFFAENVAGPLNADFYIGVPQDKDYMAAEILEAPPTASSEFNLREYLRKEPESMGARAFINPPREPAMMNTRIFRSSEIPSTNGNTSAHALAKIYGTLSLGGELDGVRIIKPETIEALIKEQFYGKDIIMGVPVRRGLGFMLTHEDRPLGPNPRTFGHGGMGGSLGIADLDAKIGFGYVMNQFVTGTVENPDLRAGSLVKAVYQSL